MIAVVLRNAFFAHPDQFLLVMCTDKDETVGRETVSEIRKLRDQYLLNTEDEAFPEVKEDDESSLTDEDLLTSK